MIRFAIELKLKMEIFNWTQGGIDSLKSFREEQGNIGLPDNEQVVQGEAQ